VKAAALAQDVPIGVSGGSLHRVAPEGVSLPQGTEAVSVFSSTGAKATSTRLAYPFEGREFRVTDRADTPRVAVVNE
jgi:hypothetical protein